eukprot:12901457-Prorocentrum_lima.AAC.1
MLRNLARLAHRSTHRAPAQEPHQRQKILLPFRLHTQIQAASLNLRGLVTQAAKRDIIER